MQKHLEDVRDLMMERRALYRMTIRKNKENFKKSGKDAKYCKCEINVW
jgi:hypothetical protein